MSRGFSFFRRPDSITNHTSRNTRTAVCSPEKRLGRPWLHPGRRRRSSSRRPAYPECIPPGQDTIECVGIAISNCAGQEPGEPRRPGASRLQPTLRIRTLCSRPSLAEKPSDCRMMSHTGRHVRTSQGPGSIGSPSPLTYLALLHSHSVGTATSPVETGLR